MKTHDTNDILPGTYPGEEGDPREAFTGYTEPMLEKIFGPRPRFTYRQREFARHYAMGKRAPEAAIAAGYAASTAETNAARLLSQATICRYIDAYRIGRRLITQSHLELARQRILHILETSMDEKAVLHAVSELRQMERRQDKNPVNWAVDDLREPELVFEQIIAPQNQDQIEGDSHEREYRPPQPAPAPPETDTLPSGEPAFDLRLTPVKQEITKKSEPVIIEFVPVHPRPQDQDGYKDEQDDGDWKKPGPKTRKTLSRH